MIAKKNPRKKTSGSGAGDLINYILDAKGHGAKVLYSWATNCSTPEDLDLSAVEIETTPSLNTRSAADKTYHLVVSLAPGERLTQDQFRLIEEHFCRALGLADHQRICAVHDDTKHMHMHLAISKVHPQSLRCIGQFLDYKKLMAACRELELEYGLSPGIHKDLVQERSGAQVGEVHRHTRSFSTWLQEHVQEGLTTLMATQGDADGWTALQDHLANFDVEVRERGAGFVFAHRSLKLFVKASGVDRNFSRKRLEEVFGPFDAAAAAKSPVEATVSYRAAPMAVSKDSERLLQAYSQEKEDRAIQRAMVWAGIKETRAEKLAEIKQRYATRRLEVKLDRVIRKGRKHAVYKALGEQMKAEIQACYRSPERSGATAEAHAPRVPGWRDWLQTRAQAGDEGALGVLRHRARPLPEVGLGVLTGPRSKDSLFTGIPRVVSRDGVVEYKMAGGAFVDNGRTVVVKSDNPEVIKAAVLVAQAKFGASLRVDSGHELFATAGLTLPNAKERSTPEIASKGKSHGRGL